MIRVQGGIGRRNRVSTWVRIAMSAGIVAVAATGFSSPAEAKKGKDSGTVQVDVAGSWYQPNPTCDLLLGCVELPVPSPYPADTVHVGVLAGTTESRTFVSIELPQGKALSAGTLVLPADTALSRTPGSARLQACLATGNFRPEDQGVTTASPTALCDSLSSPVEIQAAEDPAALDVVMTVDLAPFLPTWSTQQAGLLAILPVADVAPTEAWHVAFSTPQREDPAATSKPISAEFTVGGESPEPEPTPDPEPSTSDGGSDSGPGSVSSGGGSASFSDAPAADAPEMSLPEQAAPADAEAPAAGAPPAAPVVATGPMGLVGYRYPGVYLVPLLFALGLVWSTRAFTVDLTKGRR